MLVSQIFFDIIYIVSNYCYFGISPLVICSTSICLCISPKLSNFIPQDLHVKYWERFSAVIFPTVHNIVDMNCNVLGCRKKGRFCDYDYSSKYE